MVECEAMKPCCVGEKGMCVLIVLRISLQKFLTELHSNKSGLYDEGYVGVLFSFTMGIFSLFWRYLRYWCALLYVEDDSER